MARGKYLTYDLYNKIKSYCDKGFDVVDIANMFLLSSGVIYNIKKSSNFDDYKQIVHRSKPIFESYHWKLLGQQTFLKLQCPNCNSITFHDNESKYSHCPYCGKKMNGVG